MKMTKTDRSQTMTPASMNKTPTIAQMTTNFQSDYALAHAQVSPYTCANCQEPVCPSDLTEYISCLPSLGPYEGRIKAPASINGYRACDSGLHPSPPLFFYGGRGGTRTLAYMGYRAERLRIVAMYAGKEKKYYCKTSARNAIGKTWSYKNSTEERGPVGDK